MRTADLPLLPLFVRIQHERTLAGTHQKSHAAHRSSTHWGPFRETEAYPRFTRTSESGERSRALESLTPVSWLLPPVAHQPPEARRPGAVPYRPADRRILEWCSRPDT